MRVRAELEEGTQVHLLRYLKCPRASIRAYVQRDFVANHVEELV